MKEVYEAMDNVTLKGKDQLKRWLVDTGRRYLVFDSLQLVDSLSFPEGISILQGLIKTYSDYRSGIPTGKKRVEKNPVNGEDCEVDVMHTDTFTAEELEEVFKFVIKQIIEIDPNWRIPE